MKYAAIGTWKMAEEGIRKAIEILKDHGTSADAATEGISLVEDNPDFHSVGYSGRPDINGRVLLDGGFMDGDTLRFGAVGALEGFRSPVSIARSLMSGDANNFLVGKGAEFYAEEMGFERRDNLTEEMKAYWLEKKKDMEKLSAYDGHDTVCFLVLDEYGTLTAATSTSGLAMKREGRIGDTPIPGCGFYADSKTGAAAATGMGEEIMKGSLSYAAVMYMKQGMTPMKAAQKAVNDLDEELKQRNGHAGAMSLIAMNKNGEWGVGTNIEFPFVTADDLHGLTVHTAYPKEQ